MSIPLICDKCGDIVGIDNSCTMIHSSIEMNCPGKGNHPEPKRTEITTFFRLIRVVNLHYSLGWDSDIATWGEYIGPRSRFLLWVAVVFGSRSLAPSPRLIVNDKWVFWSKRFGLFGDGLVNF